MAKELYPSSYQCDCGHESDFFENTIDEMRHMSKRTKQRLADGSDNEHTIVFYKGRAIEVICPRLGKCAILEAEL